MRSAAALLLAAALGRPAGAVHDALLPSADAGIARTPPGKGHWWTRVGDRVYFRPTASLGLSGRVSDYYATLGSRSALTPEMERHRVGGEGQWHILHLPGGPSMLQAGVPTRGDRRSSFSSLIQLRDGKVLTIPFPAYALDSGYHAPPSGSKEAEKSTMAKLTEADVETFLGEVTAHYTRSFSNGTASHDVQNYLQRNFEQMGLHTCVQDVSKGETKLANVIAHVPGRSPGSVTLGAHFDSRPFSGSAPGANDNGSGVAALLAIAKAFASAKVAPEKTVYFVGFGGEEAGLYGSEGYVAQLKTDSLPAGCGPKASLLSTRRSRGLQTLAREQDEDAMTSPHRAIIMDEVGWVSPSTAGKHTVNLESLDSAEEVMQHMGQASQEHNGGALALVHNSAPFGSDHMSFLDHDIPAVLAINADDEAYPGYHTSRDTLEKVTPAYVLQIAKMCLGGLVRLSCEFESS